MSDSIEYTTGCPVCDSKQNFYHCPTCGFVFYCGEEHQKEDLRVHKPTCDAFVSEYLKYERIKAEMPVSPDFLLQDTPQRDAIWNDYKNHFASYAQARIRLARVMEKIPRPQVAQKRIKLLRKALLMFPTEPTANACLQPMLGLMFRLNGDDETYTLMKLFLQIFSGKYKWPRIDQKDFSKLNAFNDINIIRETSCPVTLRVGLVILKLRVIAELKKMPMVADRDVRQVPEELKGKAHFGFLEDIATTGDHGYTMCESMYQSLLASITTQVRWLIVAVKHYNPRVWAYLFFDEKPSKVFKSLSQEHSHAIATMIRLHLREALRNTPDGMEFIRSFIYEGPTMMEPRIKPDPDIIEEIDLEDIPFHE
ncbi:hypothetical protein P170DRAFT_425554 [Aspergillus steynii IBT 23096]|uniref:MYND-type domain-containing protein n=1 Tax=Aspergillus steynii IBT 23096 TaxID=1392250 RepID=A0A2I2GEP7_9EURO|nr:uncharacterized protein P170DRAFT_425554 [Aspergillus steynii IBT 23096]PLB51321.1 hypothetical protein P170DRAFT_425554 [Aspergillus steynii IBT 23096]